jgi:signal transduction histidine kinase
LLRMDFPQAEAQLAELVQSLEGAMQTVRQLILELSPSPVRALGLKGAMEDLAARHAEVSEAQVTLRYSGKAGIPADVGDSLYYLAELTLREIPVKASRIRIQLSGTRHLILRIQTDCRFSQRGSLRNKAELLAKSFGFEYAIDGGQVTISTVRYALRRSAG